MSTELLVSSDLYNCPICLSVKPQIMCPIKCMHNVCLGCYEKLTNAQKKKCSLCNTIIDINPDSKGGWIRNTFAERQLTAFTVACQYNNCPANKVEVAKYTDHITNCEFRPMTCKSCDWTGPYNALDTHVKMDCQFVMIKCKYCENKFYKGAHAEHELTCNYQSIECSTCKFKGPKWRHPICTKPSVAK